MENYCCEEMKMLDIEDIDFARYNDYEKMEGIEISKNGIRYLFMSSRLEFKFKFCPFCGREIEDEL